MLHRPGQLRRSAFTLVELLVVTTMIVLLIGILLPALKSTWENARLVATHSDLRQIDLALKMYEMDQADEIPPVRGGCSTRMSYELPPELAEGGYLPLGTAELGVTIVDMTDRYMGLPYRFRAPGPMIMNEFSLLEGRSGGRLFIPGDFPSLKDEVGGRYVHDPAESPVRYAVWSAGPSETAPKMTINPGRGPLLERMWMDKPGDPGLVVHAISAPHSPYPDLKSP